ncbi:MAG: BrnT family toxin [Cellvibrionaceae bacterium]|nr:BrnT family toxin [Cellvibrionaceae bacterium]
MELLFEWNKEKESANIKKHGLSFEQAKSAFFDENAIQFYDPDHSSEEARFILLDTNNELHTLVICHCFREEETRIRIISARKTNKEEANVYNVYWGQRK